MHLLIKVVAIALIIPAFFFVWMGIRLLRTPRRAFESYQRLIKAVRAVNRGKYTAEQLAIVKDAEKMHLVEGVPYFVGHRSWNIRYHRTHLSDELFWNGQPQATTAEIDEELAGYEVRPSVSN